MVDKNDFLRNIIMAFSDPQYDFNQLYRYVGKDEFEKLFRDNEIVFTNPRNWRGTDCYETYFEEWWYSREHLVAAYKQIKKVIDYQNARFQIDNRYLYKSIFSELVACIAFIQQKSFCYCMADRYTDVKMVMEYHRKYGRNIVIKYKPRFFEKIAILGNIKFIPQNVKSLYVDVFPMRYFSSMDHFLSSIISLNKYMSRNSFSKDILETGVFLKHINFYYEHEVRMKLKIMYPEEMNGIVGNDIYDLIYPIDDEDEIIDICMDALSKYAVKFNEVYNEVNDRILVDSQDREYFILQLESGIINKIIDAVYVFSSIGDDELMTVKTHCQKYNIPIYKI